MSLSENDRVVLTPAAWGGLCSDTDATLEDVYRVETIYGTDFQFLAINERTGEEYDLDIQDVTTYEDPNSSNSKFYTLLAEIETKKQQQNDNVAQIRTTLALKPYGHISEEWSIWVDKLTSDVRILLDQL